MNLAFEARELVFHYLFESNLICSYNARFVLLIILVCVQDLLAVGLYMGIQGPLLCLGLERGFGTEI